MQEVNQACATNFKDCIRRHLDHYLESDNFVCFLCPYETHCAVEVLEHLREIHQVVLGDVIHTPLIPKYLEYWKEHIPPLVPLRGTKLQTIDPEDQEDDDLRKRLHKMRLEMAVKAHDEERRVVHEDIPCLFCTEKFTGTWHEYLQRLFEEHQFNPGRPDNLVYIPEMVERLRSELMSNTCIFCNSVFPNQRTLKSHLRKKKHMKIPSDPFFDRFYMVNYLELNGDWRADDDDDRMDMEPLESAIRDLSDTEVNETTCLICDLVLPSPDDIIKHMKEAHAFDIADIRKLVQGDFYNSVRIVNYCRYQKARHLCFVCGATVGDDYAAHIGSHDVKLPSDVERLCKEDQLLIPVIESDPLLTELENDDE